MDHFCDGACDKLTDRGGFAAVAVKRKVIYACLVGWMDDCEALLEAEMRSILAGVELGGKMGMMEVDIVSYSVEAVWAFMNGHWVGGHESHGLQIASNGSMDVEARF